MSDEDTPQYIKVSDLAAELGRNRGSFSRTLRNHTVELVSFSDAPNAPLYISTEDADRFREQINNPLIQQAADIQEPPKNPGVYLVQVPSYEGVERFKIGWSDHVSSRFADYRTIVPDLKVLRFWPTTYRHLERTALMVAERNGRRVYTELFEFSDPANALEQLDTLFGLAGIEPCQM